VAAAEVAAAAAGCARAERLLMVLPAGNIRARILAPLVEAADDEADTGVQREGLRRRSDIRAFDWETAGVAAVVEHAAVVPYVDERRRVGYLVQVVAACWTMRPKGCTTCRTLTIRCCYSLECYWKTIAEVFQ
jgi:hypothetical protein